MDKGNIHVQLQQQQAQRPPWRKSRQSIVEKFLSSETAKIIHEYKRLFSTSKVPFLQLYRSFYSKLFSQAEQSYIKFYDTELQQKKLSNQAVLLNFMAHFRQASQYIWTQLAKPSFSTSCESNSPLSHTSSSVLQPSSASICSNCSHLIASRNIELEKARMQAGQFYDPFNMYGNGIMEFQQESVEKPEKWQQIQCEDNQRQVYAYLFSLKERISSRMSEIIGFVNQLQKYGDQNYVYDFSRSQKVRDDGRNGLRTFDFCYKTVIGLVQQKIIQTIRNLKTQLKYNQKSRRAETECQTQPNLSELYSLNNQIKQLKKQLQSKYKQVQRLQTRQQDLYIKLQKSFIQSNICRGKIVQMDKNILKIKQQISNQKNKSRVLARQLEQRQKQCDSLQYELKNLRNQFKSGQNLSEKDPNKEIRSNRVGKRATIKKKTTQQNKQVMETEIGFKINKEQQSQNIQNLEDKICEQLSEISRQYPQIIRRQQRARTNLNFSRIQRQKSQSNYKSIKQVDGDEDNCQLKMSQFKSLNNVDNNSEENQYKKYTNKLNPKSNNQIKLQDSFIRTPQFMQLNDTQKQLLLKQDRHKIKQQNQQNNQFLKQNQKYTNIQLTKTCLPQIKQPKQASTRLKTKSKNKNKSNFQRDRQRLTAPIPISTLLPKQKQKQKQRQRQRQKQKQRQGTIQQKQQQKYPEQNNTISKFKTLYTEQNSSYQPIHSHGHSSNRQKNRYQLMKSSNTSLNMKKSYNRLRSLEDRKQVELICNANESIGNGNGNFYRLNKGSGLFKNMSKICSSSIKNKTLQQFQLSMGYGNTYEILSTTIQQPINNNQLPLQLGKNAVNSAYSGPIFANQDIKNLYFSLQYAIQHQKIYMKPTQTNTFLSTKQNFNPNQNSNINFNININYSQILNNAQIKYLNKICAYLAAIHQQSNYHYRQVKNLLLVPYGSFVMQNDYFDQGNIGNSNAFMELVSPRSTNMNLKQKQNKILENQGRIKQALISIILMHRQCKGGFKCYSANKDKDKGKDKDKDKQILDQKQKQKYKSSCIGCKHLTSFANKLQNISNTLMKDTLQKNKSKQEYKIIINKKPESNQNTNANTNTMRSEQKQNQSIIK